jgi:predicted kinase
MKNLVLMRGIAGCGKSTFLKNNNLEKYTISADSIRLLVQSPIQMPDGTDGISQFNDNYVWKLIMELVEKRMERGEFIIIDATHSRTQDYKKYKNLTDKYKYRVYALDFTDIPLEEVKRRNKNREEYKFVPEDVLEKMNARFEVLEPQSFVTVIKPEDFNETFKTKITDLSNYKKIHHIGDIHGCNTVLQEYLKNGIDPNEFYIFVGDYIDRGIENGEVMNFLKSIINMPNVVMLEGNHEIHLKNWGYSNETETRYASKEFMHKTVHQLVNAGFTKKDARMFYRKLYPCLYYKFHDKNVIVTHAGISKMPENIAFIACHEMIRGVGMYDDMNIVNNAFMKHSPNDTYQVHGHRNKLLDPIQINDRCFNLNHEIESGGNLRCLTLDSTGFTPIEIKNTVFKVYEKRTELPLNKSYNEIINLLNSNNNINKRALSDNVISYNFTSSVFRNNKWNSQTIKARGLFINLSTLEIVSRSYEKFFNVDQRNIPEVQLSQLIKNLQFPVKFYLKYNGFLGIIGYNSEFDKLFISSKSYDAKEYSNNAGNYALTFEEIFNDSVTEEKREFLKNYNKINNTSAIFEVIHPEKDPHIIEYSKPKIILLDLVRRTFEYEKLPYDEVQKLGNELGIEVKELCYTVDNIEDFLELYNEVNSENYKYNNEYVEGFVIEDATGFMTKTKGHFYNTWKNLRGAFDIVLKNGKPHESKLYTAFDNYFYGWCRQKMLNNELPSKTSIIDARNMYFEEKGIEIND